ncbi:MAG: DEAD/DEAH box helicase [Clostridia bacterium]|nr:DEAD/DEAH box helicase [Clostridia bacterium]
MIPSVLASRFRDSLIEYMEASYPITTSVFRGSIRRFMERENNFAHEPYISVKLPFRVAEHGNERFEALHPAYPPYVHQNRAYDRLCGTDPVSTLVATGTGSGKTECFLYPILEYCYAHKGEPGIKAIIVYPMNALASDQALRIARLIHGGEELRGNITAGMFVGGFDVVRGKTMKKDAVITDHETILNNPPDILMTNYKMLDYLLVRPEDARLWAGNETTGALRFIVVDELHTFDGVQGTDLACLLRRLKSRLNIPRGDLCCVGTSATMGGEGSAEALLRYAEDIFEEPFEKSAIVTEDRLTGHEFLSDAEVNLYRMPTDAEAGELGRLAREEDAEGYLEHAIAAWFEEEDRPSELFSEEARIELAGKLMHHSFFQSLMGIMDGKIRTPSEIQAQLRHVYPEMAGKNAQAMVDSMLALISHARIRDVGGYLRPFLQVQVQVWMRELRRVLARVDGQQSELLLESDLNQNLTDKANYLPIVNCRDCGMTGWTGCEDESGRVSIRDLRTFYTQFFGADKHVRMIFPRQEEEKRTSQAHQPYRYCPDCQNVQLDQGSGRCTVCGKFTIPVWYFLPESKHKNYLCPFCGGNQSVIMVGLQSATAISVGLSRLYASRFNDDKKVLAFSDNVQDASHRASFFNARTWPSTFRIAMQHFVEDGGEGLSISQFGQVMGEYWLSKMDEAAFVDTFIPFNMSDDHAYEVLRTTGHFPNEASGKALVNDVRRRMALETVLEYGRRSRFGRTLERSGASMACEDERILEQVAEKVLPRIENEAGVRDLLTREQLVGFLHLWVTHMRKNGAFSLPLYRSFVEAGGNDFLLSSGSSRMNAWMPDGYVTPLFVAGANASWGSANFEMLSAKCWYTIKFLQMIGKTALEVPGYADAISLLIHEAEKAGLLSRMAGPKGMPVFGLNPDMFHVTSEVARVRCSRCGQLLSVHKPAVSGWTGVPCIRQDCGGTYEVLEEDLDGSYRIYSRGDPVRIHASEHTGLLDRPTRETLETAFKHDKVEHRVWDPNLLSCTPTLEMGIDIGDLSTVVLCQVPPGQAQYIQRVGRAGRKDGNAFTVTVAGTKQHDLYFYQEPTEMIAGVVEPPAVFLNASAVLERQFMAFCFDCWVKSGVPETAVPDEIKSILSRVDKETKPAGEFPFNVLTYMHSNLARLERRFTGMFGDRLEEETKQRIHAFVLGEEDDSPEHRLLVAFTEVKKDRDRLQEDIRRIDKAIKELEKLPKDSSFEAQKKELYEERKALASVIKRMNENPTFNFLSDEGILPNYAFPEAGITLKAVLTRRKRPEEVTSPYDETDKVTYEYGRGAAAAISEFAPHNSFYAAGRKLEISRIDVKTTEPETWRLCPNCNYAAQDSTLHNVSTCPRCGSPAWADTDQKCTMLRPRTVYSDMKYEAARSGDESDDRASRYYTRQLLVDVDEEKDVLYGYRTTGGDLPFGYDFVKKATMREINFGENDVMGKAFPVAGITQPRKGFTVCHYCGMVQRGAKYPSHTPTCKARQQGIKDPFDNCMFLYREFVSEAVRILIPAIKMEDAKKVESFAAAIMLGLRKKFGSVDHLRFTVVDVPEPDSEVRKSYMVIYDTVPGGTGYLKQLTAGKEAMMDLFQLALEAMENCSCASDPEKDGCYHCVYGYRQSNRINQISRRISVDMVKQILSGRDSLEKIPNIRQISVNTLLDSLLEAKFLEALSMSKVDGKRVEMNKAVVGGKEGYALTIGENLWRLELQVPLSGDQGVRIPSKPDFVFRPQRNPGRLPVAVFTDGKTYHIDIAGTDVQKRMAIREGLGWTVWSLTWQDVLEKSDRKEESTAKTVIAPGALAAADLTRQTLARHHLSEVSSKSSFDLLLEYLGASNGDERFRTYAAATALGMLRPRESGDRIYMDKWMKGYSALTDLRWSVPVPEFRKVLIGMHEPVPGLRVYAGLPADGVTGGTDAKGKPVHLFDESRVTAVAVLDDQLPEKQLVPAWRGFLYMGNLLQFIPKALLATIGGIAAHAYDLLIEEAARVTDAAITIDPRWKDIIEGLVDQELIDLAKRLRDDGVPAPEAGLYAEKDDAPMSEFQWSDRKVLVQSEDEAGYKAFLQTQGWKVYGPDYDGISLALKEV